MSRSPSAVSHIPSVSHTHFPESTTDGRGPIFIRYSLLPCRAASFLPFTVPPHPFPSPPPPPPSSPVPLPVSPNTAGEGSWHTFVRLLSRDREKGSWEAVLVSRGQIKWGLREHLANWLMYQLRMRTVLLQSASLWIIYNSQGLQVVDLLWCLEPKGIVHLAR